MNADKKKIAELRKLLRESGSLIRRVVNSRGFSDIHEAITFLELSNKHLPANLPSPKNPLLTCKGCSTPKGIFGCKRHAPKVRDWNER